MIRATTATRRTIRHAHWLLALLLLLTATALAAPTGSPLAWADTSPIDPSEPQTVSSDSLPTAQIDGVAWSQQVSGNVVFVGGSFANARPANSAPGVNTVARPNLMSYDLTNGVMTSWAPNLNGQVRSLAVSPDGNTLYVAGQFTSINGLARYRLAAFDISTPALKLDPALKPWAPNVNATVYGIYATASTLYFGGPFSSVNGTARAGAAAINPTTNALTGFAPTMAGGSVREVIVSPDGTRVVLGGNFTSTNGTGTPSGYGLALLDTATGASLPMPVNGLIRDAGANAAIMSLAVAPDGQSWYGTGYSYQKTTGNLEGAFKADWSGNLIWVEDCHGDSYSIFPMDGVLYVAGHSHYCGNVGGYPQTSPTWTFQRVQAFTEATTPGVTIEKDPYGYFNYEGQPRPTLLNWFPDLEVGAYTGQSQAAWNVAGNADYLVVGGEFPSVNYKGQQGLARFARTGIAPNNDGPRLQSAEFVPTVTSFAQGMRVNWPANYDRDNTRLTYTLFKNNATTPIYTTTVDSTFWQRPVISYLDREVTQGTPVTYRVKVTDTKSNLRQGDAITATPNGGAVLSAYEKAVLKDNPLHYWPLNEAAGGSTATDISGAENGTVGTSVTPGAPGAITGDPGTSYRYNGLDSASTVSTQTQRAGMKIFSLEAWFKTTTTTGGKIIGWGTKSSGNSGNSDRMIYMGRTGKVYFGVYPLAYKTVNSTASYNNGAWHHAVATLGPDGMQLYVDGALVGSDPNTRAAQVNSGYWRVGGDYMSNWPDNPPLTSYFAGDIDNAAVYNYPLAASRVSAHAAVPANAVPTASFTAATNDLTVAVDAAASGDADGYLASYAWTFGDGGTASGRTASHTYATPGSYSATLTVTDENGGTATTTRTVDTLSPNTPPIASFSSGGSELAWSFDATGSSDPDGSITSYAWNFGDGTSGSGATADHTFLVAGTYTVALTVTDDRGGSHTVSQPVTATAPANYPFVSDTFDRSVSSGLGSADIGGPWTVTSGGSSAFSVGSGAGLWKLPVKGNSRTAYLGSTLSDNTDLSLNLSPSVIADGGGTYLTVLGRRINATTDYHSTVRVTSAGKVTVSIGALQGSATETSLSSTVTLPGTLAAGEQIHVRLQVFGTSPTTVRAKVWLDSASEPSTWTVSNTSSYAALQSPGATGLTAYLSGSATNAPQNVSVLDFVARPAI